MKRYAVCGVSARAIGMFIKPMVERFYHNSQLVGLLDIDPRRFEVCKEKIPQTQNVATYLPEQFEQMIEEQKPDVLVVVGVDRTHARYIVGGLEHDLDVITEKPMATTSEDCNAILAAEAKSKGRVIVTFNYRYAPIHSKIKELVLEDKVGRVTSVDLNWYIDTYHGASYFKRWNREREKSGGLSIHKCTHHFDLVNWWIGQKPVEVFAYGALNYYGSEGPYNPRKVDGRHCGDCPDSTDCIYYMRWTTRTMDSIPKDDHICALGKIEALHQLPPGPLHLRFGDKYRGHLCGDSKFDQGAMLSYSVNFSSV